MKNKILHIFFTLLAWTACLQVGAQTTSYVLDDAKERSWSTISNSGNYNLSGPGATLTFEAKRSNFGVNYFYVAWSTDNGSTWTENSLDLSTSYKSYTYELSPAVTTVRFLSKTGATLSKYVRNVKVTRATTLSSATSSIDFGKTNPNVGTSRTVSVAYNNTTCPAQLTGTSSNPNFTVTAKSMGEYGNEEITVNYTPQAVGVHTGTVTLRMAGLTHSFEVTGRSVLNYQMSAAAHTNDPAFGQATVQMGSEQASNGQSLSYTEESSETSVSKSVTYTAVPAEGYKFTGWYSDATFSHLVTIDANYQTTLTATPTNVTSNLTLYAEFEELNNKQENAIVWKENPVTTTDALTPIDISGYASSTGGIPVTYSSSNTAVATVEGTMVYPHAKGDFFLTAIAAETEHYNEAVSQLSFTVTAVPTTIVWDQNIPALTDRMVEGVQLKATLTDSYGTELEGVIFSVTQGEAVEVRQGNLLYAVIRGTATLTASYPGNDVYAAAADVQQTVTVEGYAVPQAWVNDWKVSPAVGEQFYLYNITNSKFLREGYGEESSDAFGNAEQASLWTHNSSKRIVSVSNSANFIANRTNEASTNGDGNATEFAFNYNSQKGAFQMQSEAELFGTQHYDVFNNGGIFDGYHNGSHYEWYLVSPAQYAFRLTVAPTAVDDYLYAEKYAPVTGTLRDQLAEAVSATAGFAEANERIIALEKEFDKFLLELSRQDALILNATTVSTYTPGTYEYVIVERPVKVGFNSLALPFDIDDVSEIGAEWAAQLSLVTYNAHDGYSIYFEKVTAMESNQPYILYATEASEEMEFHDITVEAAESATRFAEGGIDRNDASYTKWQMASNYAAALDMEGKYGVVNTDGVLKIGGAGSILGAFSAFLSNLNDKSLPTDPNEQTSQQFSNHRARIATHYVTGEELLTVIRQIEADADSADRSVTVLYDLNGRRTTSHQSGLVIERRADGTARKVLHR